MDKVLLKYTEYTEPHESRTNADIIETLRKKGFNGCDSRSPTGRTRWNRAPCWRAKLTAVQQSQLLPGHYFPGDVIPHSPAAPAPQQPALQRNSVSPGLPQRPASAGAMLGGDLNSANGACPSPVGNGYVTARASPGILPVANGNSLNKVIPAKSPPPPTHSTQIGAPS
ncbi:Myocyte-specific enhancer factor 2D [Saguinus oedipus]|uniref:Myocyte-specific enhancer factor 2D n=1 Tax=Saguinus oedipus TaxID=9490 RepID=A0ABQ9UP95_SAGOE|nr:Myocyte-specific enhancer factor 2D [Saguinus oedipus]